MRTIRRFVEALYRKVLFNDYFRVPGPFARFGSDASHIAVWGPLRPVGSHGRKGRASRGCQTVPRRPAISHKRGTHKKSLKRRVLGNCGRGGAVVYSFVLDSVPEAAFNGVG